MAQSNPGVSRIVKDNKKLHNRMSTISDSIFSIGNVCFSDRLQSCHAVHYVIANLDILNMFVITLAHYYDLAEKERRLTFFVVIANRRDLEQHLQNPFLISAINDGNVLIIDNESFTNADVTRDVKINDFPSMSVLIGFFHQILCKNIVFCIIMHTRNASTLKYEILSSNRRYFYLCITTFGYEKFFHYWKLLLTQATNDQFYDRRKDDNTHFDNYNFYEITLEMYKFIKDKLAQYKDKNDPLSIKMTPEDEKCYNELRRQANDLLRKLQPNLNIKDGIVMENNKNDYYFSENIPYFTHAKDEKVERPTPNNRALGMAEFKIFAEEADFPRMSADGNSKEEKLAKRSTQTKTTTINKAAVDNVDVVSDGYASRLKNKGSQKRNVKDPGLVAVEKIEKANKTSIKFKKFDSGLDKSESSSSLRTMTPPVLLPPKLPSTKKPNKY